MNSSAKRSAKMLLRASTAARCLQRFPLRSFTSESPKGELSIEGQGFGLASYFFIIVFTSLTEGMM